ncbi:MAG: hypothetical protein EP326_07275 [Deltaproteobacteria bacterium]|nr:MAG: hypothetical protein EP326_07275 [Deltaproteobacteria bacterium]
MKYVLSLMFLVLLVSCTDEEVVQRSCTLNDQPVDCAVLDGTASTGSTSSSVKELKVAVEIGYKTLIDRDGEMVLILDQTFKETVSGGSSCSIDTRENNRLNYELIDANVLRLKTEDGGYDDLDRVRSSEISTDLFGKWKAVSYTGTQVDMIMTFHFKKNGKAELETTCKF